MNNNRFNRIFSKKNAWYFLGISCLTSFLTSLILSVVSFTPSAPFYSFFASSHDQKGNVTATIAQNKGKQDKQVLAAATSDNSENTFIPANDITQLSLSHTNLLHNSSFEQQTSSGQPRDWNYQLDSSTGNTFISQEGNRSGSFGLKFVGGGTGNLGISQPNVKTVPGRTYRFSTYIKVTNAPIITFKLGFWNEYLNEEGTMKSFTFSTTHDWQRISMIITTPGLITDPKNEFPMIEVLGLTSGAVYLDDTQLEEGSILTEYSSAQGYNSSYAVGDGSIMFSPGGDIYPTYPGVGQLGTSSNPFAALNLTNANIDSNGNFNFNGGGTVKGGLSAGSLTINGNTLFSSTTSALQVSNGGTGATSLTANGVLYGNGTNAIAALTPGNSGLILQSNGTGTAPSWVTPSGLSAGSVPFSGITSGTNTLAAMIVGSGASLNFTGTGTINASSLLGSTWAIPGAIGLTTPNSGAFTTLSATGAITGTVQDNGGAVYNVKYYGAKGDGSTDDTTAIQNAINAANTAGGGQVYFPAGTFITQTVTLYSKIHMQGSGIDASTIKLKNSTNGDLIKGQNFSSLTGGNTTGGIYNWSIQDITLDGNKVNNSSGYALRVYGYGYILQNIRVRNAANDGIYSEWSTSSDSPGNDSMEAQISNIKVHDNGGNGIMFNGPHDSTFANMDVYLNGQKGIWVKANTANGAQFVNSHSWGNSQTYAWYIEAGGTMLSSSEGEGASTAQVLVGANDVQIIGGSYFAAGGTVGIQIGDGTHTSVGGSFIDTKLLGFTNAIEFNSDGGNSSVKALAYQTTGSGYTGTPALTSQVDIQVSGLATGGLTTMGLTGNVGIGNASPTYPLHISSNATNAGNNDSIITVDGLLNSATNDQSGIVSNPFVNPGSASTNTYYGGQFITSTNNANLTGAKLTGIKGGTYYYGTGIVGTEQAGYFQNQLAGAGTISNSYGIYIDNPAKSAGTITTNYGLYVNNQTAGNTNYSAVFAGGNVGIDTSTPGDTLEVNGNIATEYGSFITESPNTSWPSGTHRLIGTEFLNANDTTEIYTPGAARSTPVMALQASGNVGIGTINPAYILDVQGANAATGAAQIYNTNTGPNADGLVVKLGFTGNGTAPTTSQTTGNSFIRFLNGNGVAQGSIDSNGSGAIAYKTNGVDFAEYFIKAPNTSFVEGDVVSVGGADGQMVTKSTKAYDSKLLGIVSSHPGYVGGTAGENKVLVGLTGQLPVKVSTENGAIHVGDLLTSSNTITGVTMKATKPGQIIAKALESYSGTSIGTIQVYVSATYADPTMQFAITDSGDLSMNGNVLGANTNTLATSPSEFKTLSSTVSGMQKQIASMSSQLNKIEDLSKQLADLEKQTNFTQALQGIGTQSALIGSSKEDMTLGGKLNVLGRTLLTDVGITGKISTGLLTINGMDDSPTPAATINTLSAPLKIQSFATAGVDFENGKLTIDTNGNLVTTGDITAKTINADKVNLKDSGDTAVVGEAIIPAGKIEIVVKTKAVTSKSRIFTSLEEPLDFSIGITAKKEGESFTAKILKPALKGIPFNWWLVN